MVSFVFNTYHIKKTKKCVILTNKIFFVCILKDNED